MGITDKLVRQKEQNKSRIPAKSAKKTKGAVQAFLW
jgi:hypothetical protein